MNISFALTRQQVLDRAKFVTRRIGWERLKIGQVLVGVEKCQGLKRGEKVVPLCRIRVTRVTREELGALLDARYGDVEVALEGFPDLSISEFIDMFRRSHRGCTLETVVTRIAFEYLDGGGVLVPSRTALNPQAGWPFPVGVGPG